MKLVLVFLSLSLTTLSHKSFALPDFCAGLLLGARGQLLAPPLAPGGTAVIDVLRSFGNQTPTPHGDAFVLGERLMVRAEGSRFHFYAKTRRTTGMVKPDFSVETKDKAQITAYSLDSQDRLFYATRSDSGNGSTIWIERLIAGQLTEALEPFDVCRTRREIVKLSVRSFSNPERFTLIAAADAQNSVMLWRIDERGAITFLGVTPAFRQEIGTLAPYLALERDSGGTLSSRYFVAIAHGTNLTLQKVDAANLLKFGEGSLYGQGETVVDSSPVLSIGLTSIADPTGGEKILIAVATAKRMRILEYSQHPDPTYLNVLATREFDSEDGAPVGSLVLQGQTSDPMISLEGVLYLRNGTRRFDFSYRFRGPSRMNVRNFVPYF